MYYLFLLVDTLVNQISLDSKREKENSPFLKYCIKSVQEISFTLFLKDRKAWKNLNFEEGRPQGGGGVDTFNP